MGRSYSVHKQHELSNFPVQKALPFLLLVAPPVFELVGETLVDGSAITPPVSEERPSLTTIGALLLIKQLIRLSGVIALLASLYVRE